MLVAAPLSDIDRPLTAGVLKRPPRQHADEPLGDLDRRAAMCDLVQRGV
jgi:hypothetical protein